MKRNSKLTLATLAMVIVVATTIAAVPGIFSSVDSTSGYTVGGSAGSSGRALCSDGVHYNTPCSLSGGTITAVTVTSPITGGGSSGSVGVACPTCEIAQPFTGTSGYQTFPSGLIVEFGLADSASSTSAVSFPITFPHALFSVTFGTGNYGGNASRNVCYISSGGVSTSGFTAQTDASTVHCFWTAWGY